jgi:pilus assembly protein CpaB
MQRRVVMGVVAALLAVIGGVLLVGYVSKADERAMAGQQPTAVLVVTKEIPQGTAAKDLMSYAEIKQLPKAAIAADAVADASTLKADNVASTALKVGEQVLSTRFVSADSDEVTSPVQVPAGMQLVSVLLDPERAMGAQLKAGDTVGVFISMTIKYEGKTTDDSITKEVAHRVLVTRVRGAVAPTKTTTSTGTADKAPDASVMVTLAVDAPLAEKVVWAKEYGKVWLSLEKPTTTTTGADGVQEETVLK